MLGARVMKECLGKKKHFMNFVDSTRNFIVGAKPSIQEKSQVSAIADRCEFGYVWDVKAYVTGLEVSPAGRCSLLAVLRINYHFSDHLELATKELWRTAARIWGGALS